MEGEYHKSTLLRSRSSERGSPCDPTIEEELTERALNYQLRRCPAATPSLEELRRKWSAVFTNRSVGGRNIL